MSAQPNTPSITRTVPAGQLNLHVTEFGTDKPPLILLHGIGSDVSSWWPVIDGLAAHYRLIVPDQRGHGRSAKPDHGYLIPDYVADLEGLINAYGIERPAIMGHSLGGLVTLGWASRNPTRAGKIVIEDAPLRTAPDVDGLFDGWIALASSTPAEAAAVYARDYPTWSAEDCWRRAEMITSTHLAVFNEMRAQRGNGNSNEIRIDSLSRIETPALLLYGDTATGGMVSKEDADRFASTLKNGRSVRVPGGSHSLHRDFTGPFLSAALLFLLEV